MDPGTTAIEEWRTLFVKPGEPVRFVQVVVTSAAIVALDNKGRVWEALGGYHWCLIPSPTEPREHNTGD